MYRFFQHRIGANLGLHYVKCPKVPFRVTLAILSLGVALMRNDKQCTSRSVDASLVWHLIKDLTYCHN